jgi:hypothetical protein
MCVTTVVPSSDGLADVICSSLLEATIATGVLMLACFLLLGGTVATGKLTSTHLSLLDRNLHSVSERKHNRWQLTSSNTHNSCI